MAGTGLTSYPRPNVAVDVVVLTVLPEESLTTYAGGLAVLVHERENAPIGTALPGRFLRENQTIDEALDDVFEVKLGIPRDELEPRLLDVLSDPLRDDRGWTVSIAHALTAPYQRVADAQGEWMHIPAGLTKSPLPLLFDHEAIVDQAVREMRQRYELRPDPDRLLGDDFTLGELRAIHESVVGEELRRDTFNRRMSEHLEQTDEQRTIGGRPGRVHLRTEASLGSQPRRLRLPRNQ